MIKCCVLAYFAIDIFLIINLGLVIKYHHVACINAMHQVLQSARIGATVANILLFFNYRNYGYEEGNLTSDQSTNYETRSDHLVNKYVNGISDEK
jgi:hypothetical protein